MKLNLVYAEISFLIILLSTYTPCQTYNWMNEWNGGAGNNAIYHSSIMDGSGNYYLAGNISFPGSGSSQTVAKFSSSGTFLWSRYFEPGGYSNSVLLALGPTGNIYVWTDRIVKIFTPGGDSVWQFTVNTSNHFAIHVTPLSEVILLDYWQDTQTQKIGFHIAKHDSLGVRLWDNTFYEPAAGDNAAISSFKVGPDSCYYVTGYSARSGSSVIVTSKILQNGLVGWQKFFNRGATPYCYSSTISVASDGSVVVGGAAGTTNTTSTFSALLLRYGQAGDLLWEKFLDAGTSEDRIYNTAITPDGAIFCSGSSTSTQAKRAMLLKYSAAGDLLNQYLHEPLHWITLTNPQGTLNIGFFLNITSGKVYISGTTFSQQDFHKVTILKFNEQGNFLDYVKGISAEYGIFASNSFYRNGSVTVTGRLTHVQDQSMFYLVNYTDQNITDASDIVPGTGDGFALLGNYPNPFNPATRIVFRADRAAVYEIRFYDPTGKEIVPAVRQDFSEGVNYVDFNGDELPTGVYFYSVSSGYTSKTGKLILLK